MSLSLDCNDGLYYCTTNVFTTNTFLVRLHQCWALPSKTEDAASPKPLALSVLRALVNATATPHNRQQRFAPASWAQQLESEVWLLCLGSPGVTQLNVLPQFAKGLPSHFAYHPFCFVDFKEQAQIWKQAAKHSAVCTTELKRHFYMDFGFMHASTSDFSWPDKTKDRVIQSFDRYSSYLLIVDEASRFVWIFLTASKELPLDIIREFLTQHGHSDGGSARTNQGGELARCSALQDMLLQDFHYTFKPTGADSPSQNSAVEIYNDKFAVRMRMLLYGSGLPAKYWSVALVHLVTFITIWCTWPPREPCSKVIMANYRIFLPSSYLALGCASNGLEISAASWIVKTSPVSSSGIPPWLKTSSISIWTLDWSNAVTMRNSTKLGISNHIVLQLRSSFIILG